MNTKGSVSQAIINPTSARLGQPLPNIREHDEFGFVVQLERDMIECSQR